MTQNLNFKVLISGDGAVGKSTFLHRLITGDFSELTMTKGHDFVVYNTNISDASLTIVFWDLGGQRQFTQLHKAYLKGAKAVIYTFDMSRISSIGNVLYWRNFIEENMTTKPIKILMGFKSDLTKDRIDLTKERIDKVCEEMNVPKCWYVSSKLNQNVKESILELAESLMKHGQEV